jgi:hypothetical protein
VIFSSYENVASDGSPARQSFGKAATGCKVTEFVEANLDTDKPLPNPRDFSGKFVGLQASGIEGNLFKLFVRCDKGYRGNQSLWLMREHTFLVLPVSNQVGDNYFGRQPRLTINVQSQADSAWLKAVNPYDGASETSAIDSKTGLANLYVVQPGKYQVFLLKPGQIICAVEYDYKEQGAKATLSAESCTIK